MSAGKDGPRDWDKEMAEIDKIIASGGGAAPAPVVKAGKSGGQSPAPGGGAPAAGARTSRRDAIFTWLRLTLGLAVGIGMTQWPYTHGCGLPLAGYLGGVATVIAAAWWSMVSSWKSRSGFAHFLSVALLFWGAALAAREVLPRIGYAKQAAGWRCEAPRPAPAPTRGAPLAPQPAPAGGAAAAPQPAPGPAPAAPTADSTKRF